MIILKLLTFFVIALIFAFFLTQIIIPAWRGTKWFWLFRSDSAEYTLEEAKELVAEDRLYHEAKKLLEQGLEEEAEIKIAEATKKTNQRIKKEKQKGTK